jgi:hypothetical protein
MPLRYTKAELETIVKRLGDMHTEIEATMTAHGLERVAARNGNGTGTGNGGAVAVAAELTVYPGNKSWSNATQVVTHLNELSASASTEFSWLLDAIEQLTLDLGGVTAKMETGSALADEAVAEFTKKFAATLTTLGITPTPPTTPTAPTSKP